MHLNKANLFAPDSQISYVDQLGVMQQIPVEDAVSMSLTEGQPNIFPSNFDRLLARKV